MKTTKPKLLILVSFFSGEDIPSTDTSHYIPVIGSMPFRFLGGPPCIAIMAISCGTKNKQTLN